MEYIRVSILLKEALDMYKRLNVSDNVNVANCLHDIGSAYGNLNDYDKGLAYNLEALGIYVGKLKSGDSMKLADCYYSIGVAYHKLGYYQKSLHSYLEALLMYKRIGGAGADEEFTKCLANMQEANESFKKSHGDLLNNYNGIINSTNTNTNSNQNSRRIKDNPNSCTIS